MLVIAFALAVILRLLRGRAVGGGQPFGRLAALEPHTREQLPLDALARAAGL